MEADELRGVRAPTGREPLAVGASGTRARFAWLRRYVQKRVDDRLATGALERALRELRARPEDLD